MAEKSNHVLVVDDEPLNRELLEDMLIPLGYTVSQAQDGAEALKMVKKNPPDVILLDVMMPLMDGFEVTRQLKSDEDTKLIPVVMVTALREVENRIKALDSGANDFMSKPVDMAELTATVGAQMKIKAYHDHMRNYSKELETEVAKRTEQLKVAFDKIKASSHDTIVRLSRAAEYKDEDTGAHIKRMSYYSALIARTMGLDDQTVESILYATPMHDVGKIGIPDKILLKPGRLVPEEWKIMRLHTKFGAEILSNSEADYIQLGEIIAFTHHEKWDGTGYPEGLKGKEIPLAGRITAIADVFDALTSKRPYKEPWSLEKSFDIMKKSSGSHFDPDIVEAFFSVENEILKIKSSYRDEHESKFIQLAGVKND